MFYQNMLYRMCHMLNIFSVINIKDLLSIIINNLLFTLPFILFSDSAFVGVVLMSKS